LRENSVLHVSGGCRRQVGARASGKVCGGEATGAVNRPKSPPEAGILPRGQACLLAFEICWETTELV